jgi:hypothetical protein
MTPIARLAAVTLSLAAPQVAVSLEPRYDHRDQQGVLLALETWRESVAVSGHPTFAEVRPRLRAGWGFDLSGEGDELILGGALRLGDWRDPEAQRYLLGLDARYRGYFGTEELKTFFEVGLWAELKNRLAVGPAVGIGLSYDPSRSWGAFASLHFGTAFGDARIASLGASVGVQVRYE